MKRRDVLLTCLGSSCIISGLSIFGFYTYYNNKITSTIQDNLDKSTIYVSSTETSGSTGTVDTSKSTLIDTTVEIANVDGDQTIEKVKTYSNVLSIPDLDILAYINEGVSKNALAGGVGRHEETAEVGSIGNCVVAGHASDIYNCVLNNLKNIQLFDPFEVYDASGSKHTYYVTQKFICEPDDVGILTSNSTDKSVFTIYTCTDKGTQRLVVEGTELTEQELARYKENLHNMYVTNMLNFNKGYNIESIYTELQVRELAKNRHYSVDYIKSNKDITPIVTNLYGVAPKLKQISTSIGFDIRSEVGGSK